MKKRFVAVLLVLLVASSVFADGMFGIEFGDTEEILKAKGMNLSNARCQTNITEVDVTVNDKDPVLSDYTVFIDKDRGVVRIAGHKSYVTDGRGSDVKKDFDELEKALMKEWGEPQIEREPSDTRHLVYNIVDGMKYESVWNVNFWEGVKTVRLRVESVPMTDGKRFESVLTVEYENRFADAAFQKHNDQMRKVKGKWYDVL